MKIFSELLEDKKRISEKVDYYSNQLNKFEKINGLIPDKIRQTETFKTDKIGFNIWFKSLQDINLLIAKNYKSENRKHQLEKRFKLTQN